VEGGIGGRVQDEYGELTYRIIGAAMTVHRALGPGFPEEFYQRALAAELTNRGIAVEQESPIQVFYDTINLGIFYLDFLVEDRIIVELKAVDRLAAYHQQQVISYLAASGREVALLINFGAPSLEYKRVLPPRSVQQSEAYQSRLRAWREKAQKVPVSSDKSTLSAQSA